MDFIFMIRSLRDFFVGIEVTCCLIKQKSKLMNRQLLLGILALVIFFLSFFSVNAAVTPVAGCVDPQTSTAEEPKWYTVMSSHLTAADRQNRFLVWDGIRLKTEKFDVNFWRSA